MKDQQINHVNFLTMQTFNIAFYLQTIVKSIYYLL